MGITSAAHLRRALPKKAGLVIIGLTGGIAAGKSTVCGMFQSLGIPVHDSDRAVHDLLSPKGAATAKIARAFPDTRLAQGGIDRAALGRLVFSDKASLARLETILHPLVQKEQARFLRDCRRKGHRMAVLDIPLLFESHSQGRVHHVLCAHAPMEIRHRRALRRPGMTPQKLAAIQARQWSDARRIKASDAVLSTHEGRAKTLRELKRLVSLWG